MTLRPYQEVAHQYLLEHPRAGLFLDMGLGKTLIALSSLTPVHLPALVVAPKKPAERTWPAELQKWRPDLTFAVAAGSPAARRAALASGADVVVISRDNLADVPPAHDFWTVIVDESSSFKTKTTKRWAAMSKIAWRARFCWILTGTPSPNGMHDLWAQIALLDKGERLGRTLTQYRERYFVPGNIYNGAVSSWVTRRGADDRIMEKLADICLSMTTDGRVALPDFTVNRVVVDLPPAAKEQYTAMVKTLVSDFTAGGGEMHLAANAAVASNKLRQLSAGFMYHDDADIRGGTYDVVHREKLDALAEIRESVGSPLLVFYQFKAEKEAIMREFPRAKAIDGKGVLDAWDQGKVEMMLAHPASAGHGLNLQHGGHTIVWTSPTWSLEEDMQANKRLHRSGQEHPVVAHYILGRGTVDEAVLDRLHNKKSVHDALIAYLESAV